MDQQPGFVKICKQTEHLLHMLEEILCELAAYTTGTVNDVLMT